MPASTPREQRRNMVDSQVRPSDITDRRIIRAMGSVAREHFVPADLKATAYMDNPVALTRKPGARVLMEPRLYAKLLQLAEIPDHGRVLEIGSGTGYGLAVLAAMGVKAHGIEDDADLVTKGQAALAEAVPPSFTGPAPLLKHRALAEGDVEAGPFDAIIMAGSITSVPAALLDQLKSGGRLVAIKGNGAAGRATAWVRSGTSFGMRDAFDAGAAPLTAFQQAATFAL